MEPECFQDGIQTAGECVLWGSAAQITQRLVVSLTRLGLPLSAVASISEWQPLLSQVATHLQTRRFLRLHQQAAAAALSIADHFLQVGGGHAEAGEGDGQRREGGDFGFHEEFEATFDAPPPHAGSAEANGQGRFEPSRAVRGTWAVFAECLATASGEEAEESASADREGKTQTDGAPNTHQPAPEANRLLRIRLQEALDKTSPKSA